MTHELKCWPEFFRVILDGSKKFEYRVNDRPFAKGDILHLREWLPHSRTYTGLSVRVEVLYLHSPVEIPDHVIMSIAPLAVPAKNPMWSRPHCPACDKFMAMPENYCANCGVRLEWV